MSKCIVCGFENSNEAKFCSNCGNMVVSDGSAMETPVAEAPVVEEQSPYAPTESAQQSPYAAPTEPVQQSPYAPTEPQQSFGAPVTGQTAFQQGVSAPKQPKNIYADQPTFGGSAYSGQTSQGAQPMNGPAMNGQAMNGQAMNGPAMNGQAFVNPAQPMNGPALQYMGQPQKKKGHTGLIIGLVCGGVALLAIIGVVLFFIFGRGGSKPYEEPIKTFEEAINEDNAKKMFSVLPLSDGASLLTNLLSDYAGEELMDSIKDEFDGELEIEIVSAEQLSNDELDDIETFSEFGTYGTYLGVDEYDLTDGYRVECEVYLDGRRTEDTTFVVCEWEDEWYIFDVE